jgi:hypothetical protein
VRAGIRIVTNAGGLNVQACAAALASEARAQGVDTLRIATVTGDDLLSATNLSVLFCRAYIYIFVVEIDDVHTAVAAHLPAGVNVKQLTSVNAYFGCVCVACDAMRHCTVRHQFDTHLMPARTW